jgi:hypothetical protein
MKKTLLELTQDILSAMEDDEVNSIGDTVSAMGVAQVIQNVYDELVTQLDIPGSDYLTGLESLSDVDRPNYLKMPDNLKKIHWIKYNNKDVGYLTPKAFVDFLATRDEGNNVTDFGGVTFKITDDADPVYWTTFDDEYIVMDSFNSDDGSTLLTVKSTCWAQILPQLELDDSAIPKLPLSMFPTLLATAKGRCFVNFKQLANAAEDTASRKGLVRWQNDQFRGNQRKPYDRVPNYAKPRR